MSKLPGAARIVIIGGGAIGCSIAYHLAKLGQKDVLLLEKKALTAGSTWHAAGLLGQMRSKVNLTRLMQYSAKLCETIGAETDQDVGWRNVGSIRLASSDARWEELKRAATAAKSYGFDLELIGPNEVKDKFPLVDLKDVRGATWIASDGYVDPYSLTMAYAKYPQACKALMAFIMEADQYNKWLFVSEGYLSHTLNAYAANPLWTEDPKRAAFRDSAERSLTVGGLGSGAGLTST